MDKQEQKQMKVFGFGLPPILVFLAWRHGAHHQWDGVSFSLLAAAAGVLITALCYKRGLELLFKYWMKLAHLIGAVVTTLVLTILYYLVFTPVGMVLRLTGKDYMRHKTDPGTKSYWIVREKNAGGFNQQF